MRTPVRLPFLLVIALCAPACFPALLGVGAGLVLSREILANKTYVAQIDLDAAVTWAYCKSSLTHQASYPINVDNDLRTATGVVGGSDVTITVETYDDDNSRLAVYATKYGAPDGEAAKTVFDGLLAYINEASGG